MFSEDRLAPLIGYLGQSAALTSLQIGWLNVMRPLISPEAHTRYDEQITAAIATNVEVAGTYVQESCRPRHAE